MVGVSSALGLLSEPEIVIEKIEALVVRGSSMSTVLFSEETRVWFGTGRNEYRKSQMGRRCIQCVQTKLMDRTEERGKGRIRILAHIETA